MEGLLEGPGRSRERSGGETEELSGAEGAEETEGIVAAERAEGSEERG